MPKTVMSISGSSNVSTPESSGIISASASNGEITSLSVPPAEFDWEHSGLKNPLKGAGELIIFNQYIRVIKLDK